MSIEKFGLCPDTWIKEMALAGMIQPFTDTNVSSVVSDVSRSNGIQLQHMKHVISYGLSSYGYDVRLADEFKIFTNLHSGIIDPKNFSDEHLFDYKGDVCIIPPNSFVLARSVEYFKIPRDVITICLGKSTYARCGVIVNVTAFEPEWEGHVTIEISNTAPSPVKVYANEGIVQVIFLRSWEDCAVSYADKKGKYQRQTGITLAKV